MMIDVMKKYKVNCVVSAVQGELYIRLSANIYNDMADYERVADLLCTLTKKKS
jgi:hypothetical protein